MTVSFTEVIFIKKEVILSKVGTFVIVGVTSIAGAALWTNVLEGKFLEIQEKITRPKDSNVIDFTQAKDRLSR